MNHEELQKRIQKIKSERLRDYLLTNLSDESKLDFLSIPSSIVIEKALEEKATQRFEGKIKVCENIEKDFPEELIPAGETYLLSKKLDALRLSLARLFANKMQTEDDFNEIKTFIFKFLNFQNIHLKLKVFDLSIKLLEETFKSHELNKDFIGLVDLLKLLVIDPHAFKSGHLKNINNLSEKDIKKDFYGIVYELNKKLFFEELLNLLLEKIEAIRKNNNSSLIQFNYKFIICCIEDQKMDAKDFNQLITLVFQSLRGYESVDKKPTFSNFINILAPKSLGDYLLEFEKEFKERTPQIKLDLGEFKPDSMRIDKIQEYDISIYFPGEIKNEKLKLKFYETIQSLEENRSPPIPFFGYLSTGLKKISNTLNELNINAKALAEDTQKNLREIAGTSTDRLSGLISKKDEDDSSEENTNIVENTGKRFLMLELADIKKNLNEWNLTLRRYNEQFNNIDTVSIDLDQRPEFLVSDLRSNIEEKFSEFISSMVEEFEKINIAVKSKGYWQEKSEFNKPSFSKKLLQRGYFSIDFSVEKIKAELGETPSFSEITDFILQQGFWVLLFSFGIVRWPWMDKNAFANNWAEQLCLPEILSETEKLKKSGCNEPSFKKVITLSEEFFPHKNQVMVELLNTFKSYIIRTFEKLDVITHKIEKNLSESNYATPLNSPINGLFGKNFRSSNPKDTLNTEATISSGYKIVSY